MAVGDAAVHAENDFYLLTLQRLGRALPGARVTFLLDYLERHPRGIHQEQAEAALASEAAP